MIQKPDKPDLSSIPIKIMLFGRDWAICESKLLQVSFWALRQILKRLWSWTYTPSIPQHSRPKAIRTLIACENFGLSKELESAAVSYEYRSKWPPLLVKLFSSVSCWRALDAVNSCSHLTSATYGPVSNGWFWGSDTHRLTDLTFEVCQIL
jgi:hypothetical protein